MINEFRPMNHLTSLQNFICTIGNLPTSYALSLSYEEQIWWLCDFLEKKVFPAIEENTNITEETQQAFIELQNYVRDYFNNLDVQEEINNKLDEMSEDGTLQEILNTFFNEIKNSSDDYILFAFFDSDDGGKINFFTSKDCVNLSKLDVENVIKGRDPSIAYINGKFYVAVTDYTAEHDFKIFVSEDLENWTEHYINLGLYDATYQKRWCPDWFIDDNGDVYIFISKQYANTEGSGDFETYITKCTDIDNLIFSNPKKINLTGNTFNNYIDPCCIKVNGIYHLILKNEHTGYYNLERFTSMDLENFTLIEEDYGKFGNYFEGQFIFKFNNKFYLGAEKYTNTLTEKSSYWIKESNDISNFSNPEIMQYKDIDLSHGSAIVIDNKDLKIKLKSEHNFNTEYNRNFLNPYNTNLHAFNTYKNGAILGNYLKLFSIYPKKGYRGSSIYFNICDGMSNTNTINSNILLTIKNQSLSDLSNFSVNIKEISNNNYLSSNYARGSMFTKLICFYNETDNCFDVVYDLTKNTADKAIMTSLITVSNGGDIEIKYHNDKFINNLPNTITSSARDTHKCKTDSPYAKSVYIDNRDKTSFTIKLVCSNGVAQLLGENNGSTIYNLINYALILFNGNATLHKLNPDFVDDIQVTVDDYTDNIYTLTFTGIHVNSGLSLILPNYANNGILDFQYN